MSKYILTRIDDDYRVDVTLPGDSNASEFREHLTMALRSLGWADELVDKIMGAPKGGESDG